MTQATAAESKPRRGPFRLMGALALLPWRIVRSTVVIAVRLATVPFRIAGAWVRFAKIRGIVAFFLGLALGLLFAPGPGRELREKLRRLVSGEAAVTDDELADKVSFELGHAPRTWHLPQPQVKVVMGRVELAGSVPHETARDELVRVAAAIPGVKGVDDRLGVGSGNIGEATSA